MEKEILTVQEAANFLGVCDTVVYRLLRAGDIHGRKIGKMWRIRKADLLDYFESECHNNTEQNGADIR